jgi:hypothetical protein
MKMPSTCRDIHTELAALNPKAAEIQEHFEELRV